MAVMATKETLKEQIGFVNLRGPSCFKNVSTAFAMPCCICFKHLNSLKQKYTWYRCLQYFHGHYKERLMRTHSKNLVGCHIVLRGSGDYLLEGMPFTHFTVGHSKKRNLMSKFQWKKGIWASSSFC